MSLFNNDGPSEVAEVAKVVAETVSEQKSVVVTPVEVKAKSGLFSRKKDNSEYSKKEVVAPALITPESFKNPSTGLINVLSIRGINQIYTSGDKISKVLDNFNLDIEDIPGEGQFVSLLGKSGCGKSTILRYIAGLQKPTSGDIYLYGKKMTDTDHVPMVFQQYSSFHWKSVIENVALPLLLKGVNKTEAFDKAEEIIKLVGLSGQEKKWAKYPLLSGGQLQRVAIARSLIANPQILLLDEPFSALDIKNRNELQNVLLELFYSDKIDVTFILVTHDIREAVYLSNRLYIMKSNPGEIYKEFKISFGPQRKTKETKYTQEYVNLTKEIEEVFNELS